MRVHANVRHCPLASAASSERKSAARASGRVWNRKTFPEELEARSLTAATHVCADSLISLELRIDWLNPFNFSQDRVIVVLRPVTATFPSSSSSADFSLSLWSKSPTESGAGAAAAAAAAKRLRGSAEFSERGRESRGVTGEEGGGGERGRHGLAPVLTEVSVFLKTGPRGRAEWEEEEDGERHEWSHSSWRKTQLEP